MKKKYLTLNAWALAACMGLFTLTACSDDNGGNDNGGDTPDDPVVTISLVGSWEFFEINYYEVITFNDDGTFMWYVRDYIDTYIDYGTYRNTSDRIMLDWNDEDGAEEVAYSVDGNTLSIWDPADPSDVQVYTKTNSPDIRSSGNGQLR